MTEQQIQKKIIDKLTKQGWHVVKIIKCNKNGTPDLIACKENETVWIEVKKPGGKLSPLQEYTIKQMRAKGLKVIVADSEDLRIQNY